jgi:hypothetical protein
MKKSTLILLGVGGYLFYRHIKSQLTLSGMGEDAWSAYQAYQGGYGGTRNVGSVQTGGQGGWTPQNPTDVVRNQVAGGGATPNAQQVAKAVAAAAGGVPQQPRQAPAQQPAAPAGGLRNIPGGIVKEGGQWVNKDFDPTRPDTKTHRNSGAMVTIDRAPYQPRPAAPQIARVAPNAGYNATPFANSGNVKTKSGVYGWKFNPVR